MLGGMVASAALRELRRSRCRSPDFSPLSFAPASASSSTHCRAPLVGPPIGDLRHDPCHARGANRHRAPDLDRRRRSAESLPMFTDRPPLHVGALAISYQFLWIVGGSALVIALLALFFSSTKTGKAIRACAIDRDGGAPRHSGVAHAGAGLRAQRRARRFRRRADHADAIYRLQSRRSLRHQRLHRGNRRRLRPAARRACRRHSLGVIQALAIVYLGSAFKNIAALSILLLFLFFRPTGLLGSAK